MNFIVFILNLWKQLYKGRKKLLHSSYFKMMYAFFLSYSMMVTPAFARTQTGKVTNIIVRNSDGLIYFFLDSTADGLPSCASQPYFMIKDENSGSGKRQLALLMMAKATGMMITVYGTGTCTRWPNGEDVEAIQTN